MDWNLFTGERAGTDALLLADFAKDAHGTYGADLGCGSGILLLLLLLGDESRRMTGVDIRESAAASAWENLRAFALEERGEAVCADYRSAPFESESLDFIVSNPPYFPAGRGAVSPNAERAAQRTESATVSELCSASARYLKPGGQFFLVHRRKRESDILRGAAQRPSHAGAPAGRFLRAGKARAHFSHGSREGRAGERHALRKGSAARRRRPRNRRIPENLPLGGIIFMAGTLYLVGTPIGNLNDLSPARSKRSKAWTSSPRRIRASH